MFFPVTLSQTFLENWPSDLRNMSIPSEEIELSHDDLNVLGGYSRIFRDLVDYNDDAFFSENFQANIEDITKKWPKGVFPRIGFCSWKETEYQILPCYGVRGVLSTITADNERVGRAIATHSSGNTPLFLHLREYHPLAPWSEFRMFIRDRRLVGVSQYHHHAAYPEIEEHVTPIKATLKAFSRDLIDVLHMDSVVADVFVEQHDGRDFKTTLIELNPFLWRTDPCLYSWKSGGDFDGGFRYRKIRYNPYRNTSVLGKHSEPIGHFREDDYRRS
mgnify:CR=1 FL=1